MRHLLNTVRGSTARTMEELSAVAKDPSIMKEIKVKHPMMELGFCVRSEDDGVRRMDKEEFEGAISSLFRTRPSAREWDLIPDVPYVEVSVLTQSADLFKMTLNDRISFIADQFSRRPNMVGFRWEVFVDDGPGANRPSTVSLYVYESEDELFETVIPLDIKVIYRATY